MGKEPKSRRIEGPITKKLKKLFGNDLPHAPRDNSQPKGGKLPKGVAGWSVTGRKKKK